MCDDSTDRRAIDAGQRLVERQRAEGLRIARVPRAQRVGFKAGNLNHALRIAPGEFVAIVDAEFQIPPDFLRRTLPLFEGAPRLAAVQTRFTQAGPPARGPKTCT